jgi:hypothetical protein
LVLFGALRNKGGFFPENCASGSVVFFIETIEIQALLRKLHQFYQAIKPIMDTSKETNQNTRDERSFEERVFARFDALDARTKGLENAVKRKTMEKFKTLAETLQSIAIVCGAIIGGFWTWYTFEALQSSSKAEADIRQAEVGIRQAEAQIRQLDLETREQGVVDIAVNAGQISIRNDTGRYIKIDIQVKNVGNRNLVLELPEHALTIAKVQSNEGGQLRREWYRFSPVPSLHPANDPESNTFVKPLVRELVRAGQTIDYPCWFPLKEAGLYLITFVGKLKGEDESITQQAFGEVKPISVGEHTFIVVN